MTDQPARPTRKVAPVRESIPEVVIPPSVSPEAQVESAVPVVLQGTVVKRTWWTKFVQDELPNVGTYLLQEVVLPAIKDIIAEGVGGAVEMILYGERSRGARRGSTARRTPYSNYSETRPANVVARVRSGRTSPFEDLIFTSRMDADEVLRNMGNHMSQYGTVAVSDVLDIVGRSSSYVDQKWGWTTMASFRVARSYGGNFMVEGDEPKEL